MSKRTRLCKGTAIVTGSHTAAVTFLLLVLTLHAIPRAADAWDGKILQYGEMRLVLGQGRHEGKVRLGDLTKTDHCYGVGAVAGLAGEITIIDGQLVVSRVDQAGQPTTDLTQREKCEAAMLVAAYVPSWTQRRIENDISAERLESFLRDAAQEAGLDTAKPFPFMIEGELANLDVHVINGSCPLRAKRLGLSIPASQQPYQASFDKISGRLVGIYAEGAEHRLTHHGTRTHTHALLKGESGQLFTAHVERIGVRAGSVIHLPTR